MPPKKSGLSGLTEAHRTDRHQLPPVPCLGVSVGSVAPRGSPSPAGPSPSSRGSRPAPAARAGAAALGAGRAPRCPLCAFLHQQSPAGGPRTEQCRCRLTLRPGRGAAAPVRPHAALRGLPRTRPPAAAASIINGGSGVQRLPPRETLPAAAGASLPAPRERWMRRRFPVTAMPGGGAGGAAAVLPLPLLQ